jgi:two-component system OmpR family response regulator
MRLLVVEDDAALRTRLCDALARHGWIVDGCADGEEAGWLGAEEPYDAVVLDLGLPRLDGISVLQRWREAGRTMPVLVLTARSRWADKVAGFGAGADDFLAKPFEMDEVVLRLKALIRRAGGHANPVLVLTPAEYRLLAYLMHNSGRTVSRSEIAEHIYDRDFDLDSNVIDVLVGRIRRKLAPDRLLHTERGIGFRLAPG